MKTLSGIALSLALGMALVTCGKRFEGEPTFSEPTGGTGATGGSGDAGTSGSGGSLGGLGGLGGALGGLGGVAGGSVEPNPGDAGAGGAGGEQTSPEPPVAKEGLVLWLRATHGVTHENGMVSLWADQSGSGNDATQTAENVMPRLDPGGLDGKPAMIFEQDDPEQGDFLRLPSGFSDFSQGLTVFAVTEFDQDACVALFHLGNGPEVDDIEVGRGVSPAGAYYEVQEEYNDAAPAELGKPLLLALVHRGDGASELLINQMLGSEPTSLLPAVVERTQNDVGRSQYGSCGSLQGKLSELLIYERAVSDEELLAIEGYLQQQWACCSE
jgi:hypothetical protein